MEGVAEGRVRRYSTAEGWGIVDSADTPGGCLVHSDAVLDDGHSLTAGRSVNFEWQPLDNGECGFRYRATSVSLVGSLSRSDPGVTFAGASWIIDDAIGPDELMAAFWRDADDSDPLRMRIQLDQLLSIASYSDARVLFERASLEDFLGDEAAAVPLYEASLLRGLDADRENQARIQLASSLRNVGRPREALQLLRDAEFSSEYVSARDAFVALTLWDLGEYALALRNAVQAAQPALGKYRRAVGAYAADLSTRPEEKP